jgi:hypothetical protein
MISNEPSNGLNNGVAEKQMSYFYVIMTVVLGAVFIIPTGYIIFTAGKG